MVITMAKIRMAHASRLGQNISPSWINTGRHSWDPQKWVKSNEQRKARAERKSAMIEHADHLEQKYVLSMASYTLNCHHRWRTQTY